MLIRTRLEKMVQRFGELESALADPDCIKDQTRYQKMTKELSALRPLVDTFQEYLKTEKEEKDILRALEGNKEAAEIQQMYEDELEHLQARKGALLVDCENLLLRGSDPNSNRDVIVEIRAGTGGEEAALFVADLFRMYSRYSANHDLKCDVMNSNPTGKGGFKEVIFGISGQGAYSFFKFESGIHRVQRVPETEANGRVHTSAVTVAVLPEADETDVELNDGDLKIDVFRASGAGGQHVNKTESAVRITHIPTGLVVQCQDERSQHKNKAKAMRVLMSRLYDAKLAKQHEEMAKQRKEQVGSGDRSGKIRTYNFPDQRVTDHRIGLTLHSLNDILDGHLDEMVQALERNERERKLAEDAA